MDAPFTFGKQVAFTDFTDREKDSKFLTDNLLALTNTTLISPRRWGKSSLVERVTSTIEKERKDFLVARIDLFNCRSESDFYHKYASGILSCATTRFEELASAVTKYLSRYAPTLQLSDPLGSRELSFRLEIRDTERSFDEILDLPQKIAEDRKKKVIVCIRRVPVHMRLWGFTIISKGASSPLAEAQGCSILPIWKQKEDDERYLLKSGESLLQIRKHHVP